MPSRASASTSRRSPRTRREPPMSAPSRKPSSSPCRSGDGLEVVIVNPAGVYGPGPSASVSFDRGLFEPLVRRRLPALPPGGLGLVYVGRRGRGASAGGRAGTRWRALHPVRHPHLVAGAGTRGGARGRGAGGCPRRCRCPWRAPWPRAARRSRASFAGLRCSRVDSSISSPGTLTPSPPRPSRSWAGPARRWRRACAARSRIWACAPSPTRARSGQLWSRTLSVRTGHGSGQLDQPSNASVDRPILLGRSSRKRPKPLLAAIL